MGKRSRQFEEEERFVRCEVCEEDIVVEFYIDSGDLISCEECGSEFIVKSRDPLMLFLLEDEYDEYDDEFPDEDFLGGYD